MVLGLLLTSCIPRHPPVRAETALPIDVVTVLQPVDHPAVSAAPPDVIAALDAVLTARNLVPSLVPAERFIGAFSTRRDTARRLEHLAPTQLLLLTETEVAFYSQLSGRYRWTVSVHVTLAPTTLDDTFQVPVFLDHYRQREPEALSAAAPVIARHVGQLIDQYLAAP